MSVTCLDHGPHPVREPHGPWWFTCWIPLGNRRALYVGASTGRRFTWGANRRSIRTPWLCLSLPPFREPRPRVIVNRWCAHINVEYPAVVAAAHTEEGR